MRGRKYVILSFFLALLMAGSSLQPGLAMETTASANEQIVQGEGAAEHTQVSNLDDVSTEELESWIAGIAIDDMTSEQLVWKNEYDRRIAEQYEAIVEPGSFTVDREPPAILEDYVDRDIMPVFYDARSVSKFDPRTDLTDIKMPSVRNQNPLGTCWAHAAQFLVEMDLTLKSKLGNSKEIANLSEFQTVYFMNHEWEDPLGLCTNDNFYCYTNGNKNQVSPTWYDSGNNMAYAQYLLMDWVGSVSEDEYSDTKYEVLKDKKEDASLDDEYAISKDFAHVQDVTTINTTDKLSMKTMLSEHGAVWIEYYSGSYYKTETGIGTSYYCPTAQDINHAVAVVGWDDTYSSANFVERPAGDGAWLVRNSWGSGWGDGGYFWMSYYDKSLGKEGYVVTAYTKSSEYYYYDNNYQYDGGVGLSSISTANGWEEANIFTAEKPEILRAVAIYTGADCDYTVKIYTNLDDNSDPTSGDLQEAASVEDYQTYEGYHMVELEKNVKLEQDTTFSVVVTLKSRSGTSTSMYLDRDYDGGWLYSETEAKEGEGFYRYKDSTRAWSDMATDYQANLRIKAYTMNVETDEISAIDIKEDEVDLNLVDKTTFDLSDPNNMEVTRINVTSGSAIDKVQYDSDRPSIASVDENGRITAHRAGSATITAKAWLGVGKDTIKVNVVPSLVAENITISPSSLQILVGTTEQLDVVLSPDGSDDSITWKSSDEKIAKVDDVGLVSGVKEGTATITATTGSGKSATCEVMVTSQGGEEIKCVWDKIPSKIYKYNTYIVSPTDAMKRLSPTNIVWDCDSDNIQITQNGTNGCTLYIKDWDSSANKGKGEKVKLTATVSYIKTSKKGEETKTKTYAKSVTILNLSYSISLDVSRVSFTKKTDTQTLQAVFNGGLSGDQPTNTKVKWMITDKNGNANTEDAKAGKKIVSVSGKGVVKPKGPGTAYVTACAVDSYNKGEKVYTVKTTIPVICPQVNTVAFWENGTAISALSISQGGTMDLKPKVVFNSNADVYNKDGMKLTWTCDKRGVSVSSKGVVKVARKADAGNYTITVKATGGVPKGATVPEAKITITVPAS